MKNEIIYNPAETTLGEFIANHYPDFKVTFGKAPLDMDISHGIEYEYIDNRDHGYRESVSLYPFIKWSDGVYNPCHYWGEKYYLCLEKR